MFVVITGYINNQSIPSQRIIFSVSETITNQDLINMVNQYIKITYTIDIDITIDLTKFNWIIDHHSFSFSEYIQILKS
jgi:hypothetical protein